MSTEYLTTEELAPAHQVRRADDPRPPQGLRPARGNPLHPPVRGSEDPVSLGCHRAGYRRPLRESGAMVPMANGSVCQLN